MNEEREPNRAIAGHSYRLSSDTSAEAEQFMFDALRKRSSAEKLQMVSQMNATVRALAMSGLRTRFPEDSELQLKIKLVEQYYGEQIAAEIGKKLKKSPHE